MNEYSLIASTKRFKYFFFLAYIVDKKRVVFPVGKQGLLLKDCRRSLKLTWPQFAKRLNVNRFTLEKAYQYQYCALPFGIFKKICELLEASKKTLKKKYGAKIILLESTIGKKVLGKKITKLPAINIKFVKSAMLFDMSAIESSRYDSVRKLRLPKVLTSALSEEIGIHVGDGFLSSKRYDYRLKGNKNERAYYDNYIKPLYKKLYNIEINLRNYENTYGFELSSKAIWTFKARILNLVTGVKDNAGVPSVIKVNNLKILTAFIRGVFDTDGYITFKSRYGFKKYYPCISIAMLSQKAIDDIAEILDMLGFKPYKYKDKHGYSHIDLNGYERLERYYALVGWNNKKHLKKVQEWKKLYPELSKGLTYGDHRIGVITPACGHSIESRKVEFESP